MPEDDGDCVTTKYEYFGPFIDISVEKKTGKAPTLTFGIIKTEFDNLTEDEVRKMAEAFTRSANKLNKLNFDFNRSGK